MKLRDNYTESLLANMTDAPADSLNGVIKSFYTDLVNGQRSPLTIVFYKQYIDMFVNKYEYLGNKPMSAITIKHVEDFLADRKQIYAKNAAYRSLRALFNFALYRKKMPDNFCRKGVMRVPKLPRSDDIEIVEKEEFKKLLLTCGPTFLGHRDRAILMVLYDTGLRLSELIGMTFSKTDLFNMLIRVQGKGNKRRTVSYDDSVRDALLQYINLHPRTSDVIWLSEEKRPLQGRGVQDMITRRCNAADIPHKHPHMFRHSCGVNLLEAGMDMDSIQKYLGHESLQILQVYLRYLNSKHASKKHIRYSPIRNLEDI